MTALLTETLKAVRIHGDPAAPVFLTREGIPYRDISTAFASRLVMAGVDLTTVKDLMGHKHIAMTLRYAHLAPGHKRSAIAVLDRTSEKVPAIFTARAGEGTRKLLQVVER